MTIATRPSGPDHRGGIFISYRREHTALLVGRLHDRLAARFGPERIVRDVQTVDPRDDFGQRIDEVVGSCAAFLAVMSDRWLLDRNPVGKRPIGVARDWVQREVETALARPKVLVVPVLLEGATMPGELELPYSVRSLSVLTAMRLSDASWDDDANRLIRYLEEAIEPDGGRSAAAAPQDGAPPPADAPPEGERSGGRWFRRR